MIKILREEIRLVSRFMFVLNGREIRWDQQTTGLLRVFHEAFGDEFFDHMAICYTQWEDSPRAEKSRQKSGYSKESRRKEIREKLAKEFDQIAFSNTPIYFTDTEDIIEPSEDIVKENWYTDSTSKTFHEMYTSLQVKNIPFFDCDNLEVCKNWKELYKNLKTKYDKYVSDQNVDQRYVEILENYKFKVFLNMKPSQQRKMKEEEWDELEEQIDVTFKLHQDNEEQLQNIVQQLQGKDSAQNDAKDLEIGTVVPFLHKVAPNGWLACDGKSYTQYEQPDLFKKIGTTFGGKVDENGVWSFNVPDCRGRFMRCINGEATHLNSQNNANERLLKGAPSNDEVGSIQDFATNLSNNFVYPNYNGFNNSSIIYTEVDGEHYHTLPMRLSEDSGRSDSGAVYSGSGLCTNSDGAHKHKIKYKNYSETRPANIAMQFIIKAAPSNTIDKLDKCIQMVTELMKEKQIQQFKAKFMKEIEDERIEKERQLTSKKFMQQIQMIGQLQKQMEEMQKQFKS